MRCILVFPESGEVRNIAQFMDRFPSVQLIESGAIGTVVDIPASLVPELNCLNIQWDFGYMTS